jgi:hypothetical protein
MENALNNPAAEQIAQQIATPAPAALDSLTRKLTCFTSFAALVAGGELHGEPRETDYRPSLYPQPYSSDAERRDYRTLADSYDAAQAARGDARRCYRGMAAWWAPRTLSPQMQTALDYIMSGLSWGAFCAKTFGSPRPEPRANTLQALADRGLIKLRTASA